MIRICSSFLKYLVISILRMHFSHFSTNQPKQFFYKFFNIINIFFFFLRRRLLYRQDLIFFIGRNYLNKFSFSFKKEKKNSIVNLHVFIKKLNFYTNFEIN